MSINIVDIKKRVSETEGQTQFESIKLLQYERNEYNFNLLATNWNGSSAPYTQTVAITGINTNSEGIIGVSMSANAEAYSAASVAQIRCTALGNGTLTMTAYGAKPTVDIPMHITGEYKNNL